MMYITTLGLEVIIWDPWSLLCVYIMCECQSLGYTNECVCVCMCVGLGEKERKRNGERDRKRPEIT